MLHGARAEHAQCFWAGAWGSAPAPGICDRRVPWGPHGSGWSEGLDGDLGSWEEGGVSTGVLRVDLQGYGA